MKRQIIHIDEDTCTGCELCIPNCPEGAIQVIEGKARLISDLHCDGLGACIGHCPEGAISIEEREAEPYDEKKTMENIIKGGEEVINAHLAHLREHNEEKLLQEALDFLKARGIAVPNSPHAGHAHHEPGHGGSCPGSMVMDFRDSPSKECAETTESISRRSELRHWPVQLHLLSPYAPYFNDADLLIAADCVPFAHAGFHHDILKGKTLIIFCPKLDNCNEQYIVKLAEIFTHNTIASVTIAHMEVPCCFGLRHIVDEALKKARTEIPVSETVISIRGEVKT
jgi:ferredoxin